MNSYQISLVLLCGPPGVGKSTFKTKLTDYITSGLVENADLAILSISYDNLMDKCMEAYLINEAAENIEDEEDCKSNCNNINSKSNSKWKQGRSFIFKLISLLVDYLNTTDSSSFNTDIGSFIQKKGGICSDFNLIAKNFVNCVQTQLESVRNKKHCLILLDDLMYFESMRLPFYRLAVRKYIGYFVYCLRPMSLEFLLNRNRDRCPSQQLSENIIINIFQKIEWPKNDWEKEFSHLEDIGSNESVSFRMSIELILNGLSRFDIHVRNLSEKKAALEESALANNRNIYHESDLILRRLVADRLANAQAGEEKSSLGKLLSKSKADLLAELRSKETSSLFVRLQDCVSQQDVENELKRRLFTLSQ